MISAGYEVPATIPDHGSAFDGGGTNLNVDGELGSEETKDMMYWQQANQSAALGFKGIFAGVNSYLAAKSMGYQKTIAVQENITKRKISGDQKEVAIRQLGVQQEAMYLQNEMHQRQVKLEGNLAKWGHSSETRKLQISENAKTERMKIASVSDAFSRGGARSDYSYGSSFS